MRLIWVYQGELGWGKDFKWMSVNEFKKTFSIDQAVGFVGQIKKTLEEQARDHPHQSDFYTGLRHVFAEIDGMGKLYCGEQGRDNTAQNSISFATEYLGRVDPRYQKVFGLLVDMFRHGLAHTHLTKSIRFKATSNRWVTASWGISTDVADGSRHLVIEKSSKTFFLFWIHVPTFINDTLRAIDHFCIDLRSKGRSSRIFSRFKRGYLGTAASFDERQSLPPTGKRPKKKKEQPVLNSYSTQGIDWLRTEIQRI
ncbi:MAG: hypothetical protein U0872_00950 [Planctomycetaceae bacterium]